MQSYDIVCSTLRPSAKIHFLVHSIDIQSSLIFCSGIKYVLDWFRIPNCQVSTASGSDSGNQSIDPTNAFLVTGENKKFILFQIFNIF
jgi:hypothetical protein